ncbi:DUF6345 domain-containing protein [Nocardia sp. NPDC059246]|uniref:DUF6345 domain-containing protein n=1 Tax=unclassified Nocardia TaxID=2637762 RepID=UPI0036AC6906
MATNSSGDRRDPPNGCPGDDDIILSLEQIPEIDTPVRVLELGERILAPEDLVHAALRNPDVTLEAFGEAGARAAHDDGRLVAFVHPLTGESTVLPVLESLKANPDIGILATRAARDMVRNTSLFPQDDTQLVPLDPVVLNAARHERDSERNGPAEPVLAYVRLQRQVDEFAVFGPGTRAMGVFDGGGVLRGLSHRWRPATSIALRMPSRPRTDIAAAIRAQLADAAETARVTVDSVKPAYYDSGGRYLQPVYNYTATLTFRNDDLHAADRRLTGFVAFGEELEPLPVIGTQTGPSPTEPHDGCDDDPDDMAPAPPGDPTVGRYVVRKDAQGWVDSANNFLGALRMAGFLGSHIPFTDTQYYWAEPFEFLSDKNRFVNAVDIALNEVHGNWGLFSTRDNADDLVRLQDVPEGGYDKLSYWILHSCEVIPTTTDETTSFDVWWNIFQGMRAAVGYRTEMWINDGVTTPFGLFLGLGAPVVSAWFSSIAANSNYGANDTTYRDGNRGIDEPMGRASAVTVCGHSDDTATNIGSVGPAQCLTEWWFDN